MNYNNTFRKQQKKVQCIETGITYESTHSAERTLTLRKNSINKQINPKCSNKHCTLPDGKKIHFKYI